jgi:hypothetical protein
MHVMAILDAIKKCGTFKDYKKAEQAYVEAKKAADSVEAGLALLNRTSAGSKKNPRRKPWQKPKKLLQRPKKPSQKPRKLRKQPT